MPPALNATEPRLRAIISAGLRKPAKGRPSISRVLSVLKEVASSSTQHPQEIAALLTVNASEAERKSRIAAEAEKQRLASEERESLASAADQVLREILRHLARVARENLSEASIGQADNAVDIAIGAASLHAVVERRHLPVDVFRMSK